MCLELVNSESVLAAAVKTGVGAVGSEDGPAGEAASAGASEPAGEGEPVGKDEFERFVAGSDADKSLERFVERNTYSHVSHTMSRLGDRGDAVGWWFSIVNYFGAICLVAFAIAAYRRLPVGDIVIVSLGVAAVATVMIGKFRCQEGCPIGLEDGRRITSDTTLHYTGALTVLVLMILIPRAAWWTLPREGPSSTLARLSRIASNLALLGLVILGLSMLITGWLEDNVPSIVEDIVPSVAKFDVPAWADDGVVGIGERLNWAFGYFWIVATGVVMFVQRRGLEPRSFDVTNVQAGMLYGSSTLSESAYLTAVIRHPGDLRAELHAAIRSGLICGEERRPRPLGSIRQPSTVAIAFSHAGLEVLGVEYRRDLPGDDPFELGMASRAQLLGDVGPSCPDLWEQGWSDVHVLFWIQARAGERDGAIDRVRSAFERGVEITGKTYGDRVGQAGAPRELFGFVDGVSQPWIERIHPVDDLSRAGGGKLTRNGWEPLALGEFVLGEVDEADDESPVPEPRELFRYGSFMVVRKIEQHVREFADLVAGDRELEAALVGRQRDGTPLATAFESGGAATSSPGGYPERNLFVFGDDPEGFGCPLGAHVRRANPRDALGFDGRSVHRRRIIRRGMPYQELRVSTSGGHEQFSEGLMFVAFNARIDGQFEFIQQQWLNDGAPFRLGDDPDFVAGSWSGRRKFVRQGECPTITTSDRPYVTTRGGEYFLFPALSGLEFLAG